jgi:hypothetical protein
VNTSNVVFDNDAALRRHRSSDWAERGFCATCGSNLFFRLPNQGAEAGYEMSVGAFDDQSGLRLTGEIFVDRNPGVYALAGPLTRMTEAECFARYASVPEEE